MSSLVKMIRVAVFDLYQDLESMRKLEPPWKWFKMPSALLQDPVLRRLTNAQFGAYVKMLALAAETGNQIPLDGEWLKARTQIRLQVIRNLIGAGLLVEFEMDIESNEYKKLRQIYSGRSQAKRKRKGRENETKGEEELCEPVTQQPEKTQFLTMLGKPLRLDHRPFPEIKETVFVLTEKLQTTDAGMILKCAPSYDLTRRQVEVALDQLKEDGKLR